MPLPKSLQQLPSARLPVFLECITPCAPARFAVLIIAPRLCGSSILSRIRIKGSSPRSSASASISSTVEYSYAAAYATTPDAFRLRNLRQSSLSVTKIQQGIMLFCFSYNRFAQDRPDTHPVQILCRSVS